MLRVVFMGTPEFAVSPLQAVHKHHRVVGVYTQPDRSVGRGLQIKFSAVKAEAFKLGLPVFQPEKLTLPGEFEKLQTLSPDVIVVVAYGQILKKNVLELPRLGCVNIHSSLLPRWRGAAPIQWAILGGDAESGISTMKLVEKLDAGAVYEEARTKISLEDTSQTLHDRLMGMGAEIILTTLAGLEAGTIRAREQDETRVTYASKLSKEMEWLDPSLSARELDLRVRALNPWPGTSIWLEAQRLKIKRVKIRADISAMPGLVFEKAGMVLLGCAEGSLELMTMQWEGKKEVDAGTFLNGLKGRGKSLPLETAKPLLP